MAIKKKLQPGGSVKPAAKKIVGRPMGGKIGEFQDMVDKAKRGDRQAQADLKLERAKLKTFGEGPGAGPSGAMPQPKKKMGGAVKKAKKGAKVAKMAKCKYGCK